MNIKKNIILLLSMLSLTANVCLGLQPQPHTYPAHLGDQPQYQSQSYHLTVYNSAPHEIPMFPSYPSFGYASSSFTCMPRLLIAGGLVCATVGAVLLLGPGGCSIPLISASTAGAISMLIGGLFAYGGMNMPSYTVDDHEIVLH